MDQLRSLSTLFLFLVAAALTSSTACGTAGSERETVDRVGRDASPGTPQVGELRIESITGSAGGIHYEVGGQGATVVLIHGGGLDSRMWEEEFAWLSRDFRALRYDVRGFGRSDPASEPFSHVEDLVAVLDAAEVSSASLVGLSLGGAIALDFALLHPERTDRLLLAGPAVPGASVLPEELERFRRIGRLAGEGRTLDAVEEWLAAAHMVPAMENPAIAPSIRAMARDNHRSWGPAAASSTPVRPPAAERLDEIRAPTAVIVGKRDDRSVRELARLVTEGVSGARLEAVPGAGHILNLEAPEAFAAWLRKELGSG